MGKDSEADLKKFMRAANLKIMSTLSSEETTPLTSFSRTTLPDNYLKSSNGSIQSKRYYIERGNNE
jgi:hypothetical protein